MAWVTIVFITVPVLSPAVVDLTSELGLDPAWAVVWIMFTLATGIA